MSHTVAPFLRAIATLTPYGLLPHWGSPFLLYVGPDQLLPLGSFLGAALGFLLMFWNRLVKTFRRVRTFFSSRRRG